MYIFVAKHLIKILIAFSFLNAEVFNGYTLFSPTGGGPGGAIVGTSYLMNNDMDVIHAWVHSRGAASMPYLLADSSIIYPFRVQNPTMSAGGVGGGIANISWDGTLVWEYIVSNETYQHHHDVQPLPNGNILVIAWEKKSAAEAHGMGRVSINNALNEMWSTAILELEMVPPNSANIVWEWHLWDHLIQDSDPSLPGYGIVSEHPELMNVNYGNVGGGGGPGGSNADWMHINAIDYNPTLDQIVISSRHQSEIYIIDHSTTTQEAAGHSGGRSGRGGDFLYRWGNPEAYDRGTNLSQRLDAQHGVNWIKEGSPGAGNLILYNNNYDSIICPGSNEETPVSAIFEIVTPLSSDSSNYIIDDFEPFSPMNPSWIYSDCFHSFVQSGAFRLPNGNTLISVANDSKIFEIDSLGRTVWEYEHSGAGNTMIARAQKYSIEFFGGIDSSGFPDYVVGDINFDSAIDVHDLLYVLDMYYGFYPKSPPADYSEDSFINFEDVRVFINHIMNYNH